MFDKLETKHYVMIILALVVLYVLLHNKKEGFSVLPVWPYIPPRQWSTRRRTYWSPWWYYENEYFPAVPKVVNYDTAEYRFPSYRIDYVNEK